MHINADMRGADTILLALDGVLIGGVVEADTVQGYVVQYKPGPDGTFTPEKVRQDGKVDFVGDKATDPEWMIQHRLVAIRHKLGMRPWTDPSARMEGIVPGLLEWTAIRLRTGELAYANMRQSRECDQFPLPDGSIRPIHDGRGSLAVDFVNVAIQADYEAAKAKWAAENPDLVPEYVRSKAEGPSVTK